jgi:hypothetical protein
MFPGHFYQVMAFHFVLYLITVYCYRRFDDTIKDLPLYLILFFPIIGGLFITIFYFSTTYFYRDNLPLSDYEQMLESEDETNLREKISYENEIRTMSFLDLLNYIGPERKKELLINSQYGLDINNTQILRRGLEADDKEVQHYAATLLNTRENEYTNNISYLADQYNLKENPLILKKLSRAYKDYIESGLIEEDSMGIFQKEYIETLNKKIAINYYDIDTLNLLFRAYVNNNDLLKAEELNKKIRVEFHRKDQVALNELFVLFKKSDHTGVFNKISQMDDKIINSNEQLQEIKAFYTKGVM